MDTWLAVVDWLHLLALAFWVGALVVLLVVLRGERRTRPEEARLFARARRSAGTVAWWSVIVLIVTLAGELALHALLAAGGDAHLAFTSSSLHALLFASRYGQVSVARWLLLVASLWPVGEFGRAPAGVRARAPRPGPALGIVAHSRPRPRPLTRETWVCISAMLAAAVLLCTAIAGPYGGSPVTAVVEAVHLAATDIWLGGAVVLALVALRFITLVAGERRPLTLLVVLDRFVPVAVLSAIVLVVTGLLETAAGPSVAADLGSDGSPTLSILATVARLGLILKTVLLLAFVGVGLWSVWGPRPRLRRLALRLRRRPTLGPAVERAFRGVRRLATISATLALVALLSGAAADAYPGHLAAAPARGLTIVERAGTITVALHVAPDRAGLNTFDVHLTTAGGRPVSGATVLLTAQALSGRADLPTLMTARATDGHYRGRGLLAVSGPWDARVTVRSGTVMATVLFTLTVTPSGTFGPAPGAPQPTPTAPSGAGRWQPVGPSVVAHALAVDPADRSRLYEGTIDGVYRSDDDGTHWLAASPGLAGAAREVNALAFLPDGSLVAATGDGVYRSVDGAASWHSMGLRGRSIYTLATHLAGHAIVLAGGDGGIFRSDDLGAHWTLAYDARGAAVTSLAWPAIRPALIVAGLDPGPRPIVVSLDGGATWHTWDHGLPKGVGVMSVAVAPGAQIVYVGSMGLGAYMTAGPVNGWQARDRGLPGLATGDAHVGGFAFTPARGVLYAATDYGVYRSDDAGSHWAALGGLSGDATVVTAVTLVSGAPPMLYAATAAGLYRRPALK